MIEYVEITFGAFDAEAEEIAEASDVLGGVGFIQDAVFAESLGGSRGCY